MHETTSVEATKPLRIFIVENHRDTLQYMQMYLELFGHTVLTARSMTEAIAAVPGSKCDVLISDIGLPDGDGWLLMNRLETLRPIYAIAMSGFGMSADHIRSLEVGYRHHLLKPINPKELDFALTEAMGEKAVATA